MPVIGIIGGQSHETASCLLEILESAGVAREFSVIDLEQSAQTIPVDILTAAGESQIAGRVIDLRENHFFIMNPDQKDILTLAANSRGLLITYGFNNKVCVTASSVMENEIQICVQRDLPTLSGGSVEQQEFGVSADTERRGAENWLAAITAALVAGIQVMVLNKVY
ncbi:MAG: hypothetical protein LBS84_05635 [Clostridiales bacterium]|jgi:hypothetical protein|nr:hypothetical protein [Clostridiales bacterium]